MYENVFTDQELSKLNDFVYDLRAAGQNGELLGVPSLISSYDFVIWFDALYSISVFEFVTLDIKNAHIHGLSVEN